MNVHRQARLGIISTILLLPLAANAATGFYINASIGSADLDDDFDGLTVDTSSTAYRVVGGWRFNEQFAVEGGYHDFGNFEQRIDLNGTPATVDFSADGFTVGVAGAWPLGEKVSLTGRLGMFFWDGDAEINNVSQATPEDSNLYFGVGASYAITDRFSVTGDWSRYDLEATQSNVFSVGFQFRVGK